MTIKQKIWSIPLVTILIFSLGMAFIYGASSRTYDLLSGAEDVHQPYLNKIKVLLNDLKGIQENFQNAIIINDRNAIDLARQKAEDFHKIGREIAMLDGKQAISHRMLTQFDAYFVPAVNAASIMMGIKTGDAIPDLERMLIALNKLEDTLQQENLVAVRIFGESLDNSRNNVSRMLWVNLASVVFVLIGLAYTSYRLIASIMKNLEHLRTGARKISQGDFTARIPEQGKDELTLVIQSFNSMGEALQTATGKHIQYEKQLETLNLELEDRVVTRTAELGVALEDAIKANAAVAFMADHDTLTGLLNRRRFQEEFERWGKYALRYERGGALMFIDLDKFKDINDIYGHLGGDEYLLAVAGLLKQVLRSTDYIGRWGGDEFVALLPETDAAAAREIAAKLIKTFSETPVAIAGNSLRASVSIGIAMLPEHTSDINELTAFADAAMYKAKESGRGCFRLYSASEHEV